MSSKEVLTINKCEKQPAVKYPLNPKFGTIFGAHVLRMHFEAGDRELTADITPFGPETMSPATAVLHYGQSIFEGLKVYRLKDGSIAAFRPDLHAKRFVHSAQKLGMAPVSENVFLDCLRAYMDMEEASVPSEPDHSLYIRPLLIARDEIIKIGASKKYTFYVMSSIAGPYFPGGAAKPARVLVNRKFVRAFPGGLGDVKTAGNYAASLGPQAYATKLECDQVLYLDAAKHDLIDELGGMNFFAVRDGELVTPNLTGTILPGVTRRSLIEIAPSLGLKAHEEPISFTQLVKDIKSGRVTETFACGTAAVVHSIGEFVVQEDTNSPVTRVMLPAHYPVAKKLLETLSAVQRGQIKAPGDWLF